jgi:hypothetical protein
MRPTCQRANVGIARWHGGEKSNVRTCGSPLGGARWHVGILPCGRFGGWSESRLEEILQKDVDGCGECGILLVLPLTATTTQTPQTMLHITITYVQYSAAYNADQSRTVSIRRNRPITYTGAQRMLRRGIDGADPKPDARVERIEYATVCR